MLEGYMNAVRDKLNLTAKITPVIFAVRNIKTYKSYNDLRKDLLIALDIKDDADHVCHCFDTLHLYRLASDKCAGLILPTISQTSQNCDSGYFSSF